MDKGLWYKEYTINEYMWNKVFNQYLNDLMDAKYSKIIILKKVFMHS